MALPQKALRMLSLANNNILVIIGNHNYYSRDKYDNVDNFDNLHCDNNAKQYEHSDDHGNNSNNNGNDPDTNGDDSNVNIFHADVYYSCVPVARECFRVP